MECSFDVCVCHAYTHKDTQALKHTRAYGSSAAVHPFSCQAKGNFGTFPFTRVDSNLILLGNSEQSTSTKSACFCCIREKFPTEIDQPIGQIYMTRRSLQSHFTSQDKGVAAELLPKPASLFVLLCGKNYWVRSDKNTQFTQQPISAVNENDCFLCAVLWVAAVAVVVKVINPKKDCCHLTERNTLTSSEVFQSWFMSAGIETD